MLAIFARALFFRKLEKAVAVRNYGLARKAFRQISTLLDNYSPIFWQHEMLSLPRFGHSMTMAAGKSAPPSGTLLDFLLRDRHGLLEFL